jgi:hypothetical protein
VTRSPTYGRGWYGNSLRRQAGGQALQPRGLPTRRLSI